MLAPSSLPPRPSPLPARPARPGRSARGLLAALAFATLLAGCRPPAPDGYTGYVEGEFVYVSAPLGGQLTTLAVARGEDVSAGQLLFALESDPEAAAVQEATHRLEQASHRLDNLRKGRRPSELAALEAQQRHTAALLTLAERELQRRQQLLAQEVVAPADLDAARARRDADAALLSSLEAELETARLGAREDEIQAAEADRAALAAALARAQWALARKQQTAPTAARVQDTLYRPGEHVPAGLPVVSLLPPGNLKARFFVPEPALATVRVGDRVRVTRSGDPEGIEATITYVSSQPEFTPPVIYSRENRAKLVFLVEAHPAPEAAAGWHPGQPLEVQPLREGPPRPAPGARREDRSRDGDPR